MNEVLQIKTIFNLLVILFVFSSDNEIPQRQNVVIKATLKRTVSTAEMQSAMTSSRLLFFSLSKLAISPEKCKSIKYF
jgi:hypothetical protein